MKNKAEIIGIFLYEGFVSKRSPKRNDRNSVHRTELSFFQRAVKALRNNAIDEQTQDLLKEIKEYFSASIYLKRYYPYTLLAVDEVFDSIDKQERGVPKELASTPKYAEVVERIFSTLKVIEEEINKSFFRYKKDNMVALYNSIHNYPRFFFPEIQPSEEIPFSGMQLSEFKSEDEIQPN